MNRKNNNKDFFQLKVRIFLQPIIMLFVSVMLVIMLYTFVLSGRFADGMVMLIQNIMGVEYSTALYIYQKVFRNNSSMWVLGSMLVVFLVVFWYSLSRLVKYFKEINLGISSLLDENSQEISLSPELAAVEKKIHTVRQTLEKRTLENKISERRKNELIVYLAHDIRTPLTSVIGYLSLLHETPDMPVEQKAKYTNIALEKAYRLETLINQFFEISRYNLQEMVLENERFDMYFLLVQLVDEFYPVFSKQGKTVEMQVPEELWMVGDAEKIARVFNNILRNAIAYSNPKSEITIHAVQDDNKIVVSITNTGKTIPEYKLEAIFERFYRLDESRSSESGESGLGLAIAKEIVTLHGGSITAQSEQGQTTFFVTFPSVSKPKVAST